MRAKPSMKRAALLLLCLSLLPQAFNTQTVSLSTDLVNVRSTFTFDNIPVPMGSLKTGDCIGFSLIDNHWINQYQPFKDVTTPTIKISIGGTIKNIGLKITYQSAERVLVALVDMSSFQTTLLDQMDATISGSLLQFNNGISTRDSSPTSSNTQQRIYIGIYPFCNANSGAQELYGTGSDPLIFTSGVIASQTALTLTSSINIIGSTGGILEVKIVPKTNLVKLGYINLIMPRVFYAYQVTGTSPCMINNQITGRVESTCTGYDSNCRILTNLVPTYPLQTGTNCNFGISYQAVNPVIGWGNTPEYVVLKIYNLYGPIDYSNVDGFQVETFEVQGTTMAYVDTYDPSSKGKLIVANKQGNILSTGKLEVQISGTKQTTFKVKQSGYQYMFSLITSFPIVMPCTLKFTFPPEIRILSGQTITPTGIGFLATPTIKSVAPYSTGTGDNFIIVDACVAPVNNQRSISYSVTGSITFTGIDTPAQVKNAEKFKIEMYQNDGSTNINMLGTATKDQGYFILMSFILSNSITLNSFIPDVNFVQDPSTYRAKFTVKTPLHSNSRIQITMPSAIQIAKSTVTSQEVNCQVIISGTASTNKCTYDETKIALIVDLDKYSTPSSSSFSVPSDQILQVDILQRPTGTTQLFTNPVSLRSSGPWKVSTYNFIDNSYWLVDSGSSTVDPFQTIVGNLLGASVIIDSTKKIASNSDNSYVMTLKLGHSIPIGGSIVITLPLEKSTGGQAVGISSQAQVRSSCFTSKSVTDTTKVQSICSINNNVITISLSTGYIGVTSTNNKLIITLDGLQNPRTKEESNPFDFYTRDKDGNKIDVINSATPSSELLLTVKMDDVPHFSQMSAIPANLTNGVITSYMFTFVSPLDLKVGDIMFMVFKGEAKPQKVDCAPQNFKMSCVDFSTTSFTGRISQDTPKGTLAFSLISVLNPPSTVVTKVLDSVTFTVNKQGVNYEIMSLDSTNLVAIQTQDPAEISDITLAQDKTDYGIKAKYSFVFVPKNRIGSSGSLVLTWPPQVLKPTPAPTVTLSPGKSGAIVIWNDLTRSFTLISAFDGSKPPSYTLTVDGFINPADNKYINSFTLRTFDDTSQIYKIDQVSDGRLYPYSPCIYPCKTCTSGDKTRTSCESCWINDASPYLMKLTGQNGQCKQSCDTGYTTNGSGDKTCSKCDVSCLSCVDNNQKGDSARCIACSKGYDYKYPLLQQCLKSCSNGFYQSSPQICSLCSPTCKTCDKSASNCTSCNINSPQYKLLYDFQCIDSCPSGYTSVGAQCLKCDPQCQNCKDTTSKCTSCDKSSKYKYFYGFNCFETCPAGTDTDNLKKQCFGCLQGCLTCDNVNQTKCLVCQSPLLEYKGSCLKECPRGFSKSFFGATCTSSFFFNFTIIPFPHLAACGVMILICLLAMLKDRKSIFITNVIAFWGPIQFISYASQSAFALLYGTNNYGYTSGLAFATYLVLNIAFAITFELKISMHDIEFKEWRSHFSKTSRTILFFGGLLSFSLIRLHYSHFFGYDRFKAAFTHPGVFQRLIIIFTAIQVIFSTCIILAVDVVGLLSLGIKFDTQLNITLIETAALSLVITLLEFIEICRLKTYLGDDVKMDYEALMNQMNESMDKKLRQDMLKQIMNHVRGNKDLNLNNRLDDLLDDMGPRRTKSMIEFGNELEEDPRRTKSEPASPRLNDEFDRNTHLPTLDNVYAESKPADPLGKLGKTYSDFDSQVLPHDFDKFLARKGGDFVTFEQPQEVKKDKKNKRRGRKNQYYTQIDAEDDEEADNIGGGPYDPGSQNDDLGVIKEEEDEQDDPTKSRTLKSPKKLLQSSQPPQKAAASPPEKETEEEILKKKEEEEKAKEEREKLKRAKEEKERAEREVLEREYKKKEEEKRAREEEERRKKEIKAKEEEERKKQEELMKRKQEEEKKRQEEERKLEEELLKKAEEKTKQAEELAKLQQQDPVIQVPPDSNKRTFNENDILGDFDRDDKGSILVLQDENGQYIDKKGRKVNERGYLIDAATGDIVENMQNQKMFNKIDMDERGEVPAPYSVEKYNFNPLGIKGEFDFDKTGKPLILKSSSGQLQDKRGRPVNPRGFLTDELGNIIDSHGRKKFDKKQMTPEGDFPKLFNLHGRRFDLADVCGQLFRDQNGQINFKKGLNGQLVDEAGRLVNQRGYLVDEQGNIVDKDRKKMFDRRYLKNGEFPKIFPFTKFNIKRVQGDYDMDPLGNPILEKGAQPGDLLDRQGKKVNAKGYLIDSAGNVIDKTGKVMFEKEILDNEGDIPKVFRTPGLLKADSGSSLSRLMSEIERNQPSEYGNPQWRRVQQQEELKKRQREMNDEVLERLSGNTSVDSMMEDTPSNYNAANQRFDQTASNLNAKSLKLQQTAQQQQFSQVNNTTLMNEVTEQEESHFDGDYAAGDESLIRKRRMKKKKKAPVQVYGEPSGKDIQLAKAYGGVPKGQPKRAMPKNSGAIREIQTPVSSHHQMHRASNQNMAKVAGLISGLNRDTAGSKEDARHAQSMFQLEELKEGEHNYPANITHESNDASFIVPEHHLREQRLKQNKINELKSKNKQRKLKGGGDPDFEKMFGKDIDEFLEDSDWDIESFDNMSHYSKGTSRSALGQDGKIRGLESIYLQRIETSMKKTGGIGVPQPKQVLTKKTQPRFRPLQDRFVNDPAALQAYENEHLSAINDPNSSKSQQRVPGRTMAKEGNSSVLALNRGAEQLISRQQTTKNAQTINK